MIPETDQNPIQAIYQLKHKVRFITATALFDGHDASINIMRRLLQMGGAEVIHLGHNRSVREIAVAAVEEDAQAIAVSSYQGGHMEFFKYLREVCTALGRPDIKLFGGGGGVIIPEESKELWNQAAARIYSPEDGRKLGLHGIIADMLKQADASVVHWEKSPSTAGFIEQQLPFDHFILTRALSFLEAGEPLPKDLEAQVKFCAPKQGNKQPLPNELDAGVASQPSLGIPVLGITGTGGAGKSSLTDELIRRFGLFFPEKRICVFSVDPSKRKTGGALLGDRIRMNAIGTKQAFMRSFATRGNRGELAAVIGEAVALAHRFDFDLILVETSGIGQADTGILQLSSLSLYVMTSEFGAATQLEKIDMLDFADLIAINKFDRRGSEDAFRDVCTQVRRSRFAGKHLPESAFPVYGTIASKFNDDGVNALFQALVGKLNDKDSRAGWQVKTDLRCSQKSTFVSPIIPQNRTNYLSEIAESVRTYHRLTETQVTVAAALESLQSACTLVPAAATLLGEKQKTLQPQQLPQLQQALAEWPTTRANYEGDAYKFQIRGQAFEVPTKVTSLSGLKVPRIALPTQLGAAGLVRFFRSENLPGSFPFTAGVFPFKRADEDPKRMFAGEGGPKRTNTRFHFLTAGENAKRLSTAFDSVTLYGENPAERPDIFGKVGESGVSIATLADMRALYAGFDLCEPNTSVSMTINGPAPMILAYFFNAAWDQQIAIAEAKQKRPLTEPEKQEVFGKTVRNVRGTVQADILKEDQAQNTCIFSTDFALKMMGDMQEFFVRNEVKNYYSVSISGYHIAEAGANPISQLAFTLANGFTYVEYYLSRGMKIDDFAGNLSFFFSNGMDPEYSVIGRVARRIWAIAMRDRYAGAERSQKLKYHIQTSGRSLHAQEIDFNDIRTTLQALLALQDNCNSLHTNAFDEAITTPTEASVRRSMAIQMILNREFGALKNENPLQGSYFIDWLTDAVEKAVLEEFDRLSARGGVLGSMETQYQRGKIQEESLYYETLKHSGELPIIGVNTFLNPKQDELAENQKIELARASYAEKTEQLDRLATWQNQHQNARVQAIENLKTAALAGENVFEELLHTTRVASLGEITKALYEVGGQYRRSL